MQLYSLTSFPEIGNIMFSRIVCVCVRAPVRVCVRVMWAYLIWGVKISGYDAVKVDR